MFLILELIVLSLAEDIGFPLVVLVVPLLVPCVLPLVVLGIVSRSIELGVVVQMWIVPHVRVWVIVLELPSLSIDVTDLILIIR